MREVQKMKGYYWAKGYKYTKVPTFYKRWDILGFTFTIQSHKTVRRRTGALLMKESLWKAYTKLLTNKK